MTKLLIISDDHGNRKLVDKILNKEMDADIKIHCGDSEADYEYLEKRFDYFVRGNCDFDSNIPLMLMFQVEKLKVMIVHGHRVLGWYQDFEGSLREYAKEHGCNVIIGGHIHKKINSIKNNIVVLNPGSISYPRDSARGSYLTVVVDEFSLKVSFVRP